MKKFFIIINISFQKFTFLLWAKGGYVLLLLARGKDYIQ